jgi:hypothetical protein
VGKDEEVPEVGNLSERLEPKCVIDIIGIALLKTLLDRQPRTPETNRVKPEVEFQQTHVRRALPAVLLGITKKGISSRNYFQDRLFQPLTHPSAWGRVFSLPAPVKN